MSDALPESVRVHEVTVKPPPFGHTKSLVYVNVQMQCATKDFGDAMNALGVKQAFGMGVLGYPIFSDKTGRRMGWIGFVDGRWQVFDE